jgi:hypothetical protein
LFCLLFFVVEPKRSLTSIREKNSAVKSVVVGIQLTPFSLLEWSALFRTLAPFGNRVLRLRPGVFLIVFAPFAAFLSVFLPRQHYTNERPLLCVELFITAKVIPAYFVCHSSF